MAEQRTFPASTVLSLSTGRLVCDFSNLHEAVEFLMGGPVFTHQLITALPIVQADLISRFPETDLEDRFGETIFTGIKDDATALSWVDAQVAHHGIQPTYVLTAKPEYAMSFSDPVGDLVKLRGSADNVVVVTEAAG